MMDMDQRIEIVAAIRRAVKCIGHHANFTKRIRPFLEAELPEHTIFVDILSDQVGPRYAINVWGKGLDHKEKVLIFWRPRQAGWYAELLKELDVADLSDYKERELCEEEITDQLEHYNRVVKEHLHQVKEFQRAASQKVRSLPVPKSATVRRDNSCWDKPSDKLAEKYPLLFNLDLPK